MAAVKRPKAKPISASPERLAKQDSEKPA